MHLVRTCDILTQQLRWVSINDEVEDPCVMDAVKWSYVGRVTASNGYVSPLVQPLTQQLK